jgi:hypothetical protein
VKRDLMRRVSPGEYAITPLGEAALQKGDVELREFVAIVPGFKIYHGLMHV